MRDLSLFLLKNSLGSKMKKGLRNFCNDNGSTSTLNQCGGIGHHYNTDDRLDQQEMDQRQPTLEEMILKLDLEEEIARKAKALQLVKECHENEEDVDDYNITMNGLIPGRMSCVNNSDILRSARNALNQYPRFSLDGKDAMYRSSFRNNNRLDLPAAHHDRARKSDVCSSSISTSYSVGRHHRSHHQVLYDHGINNHEYFDASSRTRESLCRRRRLPATLAGESVVWCKPGVVAKLMGIDFMPVPVSTKFKDSSHEKLGRIIEMKQSQHNMMKRRADQRHDMEKRSLNIDAARNYTRFGDNRKGETTTTAAAAVSSTTSKTSAAGNY